MKKIIIIFIILGITGGIIIFNLKSDNIEAKETITKKVKKTENINDTKKETNDKIKVDIKGEIVNPGVYEIDSNSRVIDVINLAGGLLEEADTDMINLSKKLSDEDVIIIYKLTSKAYSIETYKEKVDNCITDYNDACIKDKMVTIDSNSNKTNNSDNNSNYNEISMININTASIDELTKLTGIGESKAKNIIEYRNNNGNFSAIEDIKNVKGIGDSIFEKIKNNITV